MIPLLRRAVCIATVAAGSAAGQLVEWPVYGGDAGATKFSPAAAIDRGNVARLSPVWEWASGETPTQGGAGQVRPGNFQVTPLMINDTLYLSTSFNRVVALDATTGRQLWGYDPKANAFGPVPNGTGFVHRGVASWTDGRQRRIFMNSRWRLLAIDAATGTLVRSFGDTGVVDLTAQLGRSINRNHYTQTSPPVVWQNLVIVGNGVADRLVYPDDPPGDVQAFDVLTGRRVWSWSPIPKSAADAAAPTWQNESWRRAGHTNVWAPFSVDAARGLVYLPVSTPSNDLFGGARPGNNLYAESIVCLDARTGALRWHYQTVHHGIWDYDLPAAPVLASARIDGRDRDIVALPTKMGFLFVFDRVTGQPIWPIEERPVPPSDVAGERASRTQPFPTRPKPFAAQGFGPDDVIDFTPEIRMRALEALRGVRTGPLFTPPSAQGTLGLPGVIGGSGWGGGAFDPTTSTIYIKATNQPALFRVIPPRQRSDSLDADMVGDLGAALSVTPRDPADTSRRLPSLPINRPPYGTMTAIDLGTGEHRWQVPFGDTPQLRTHPALQGVTLPPALGVAGAPGPIVTGGGLVFATGGGPVLYALDTRDGRTLWTHDLGQRAYSVPMTYRTRAGTQMVVIASGGASGAKLTAFALR